MFGSGREGLSFLGMVSYMGHEPASISPWLIESGIYGR